MVIEKNKRMDNKFKTVWIALEVRKNEKSNLNINIIRIHITVSIFSFHFMKLHAMMPIN